MTQSRIVRAYVIGIAAWILAMILALKMGAVSGADLELVMELRLPRALLATGIGIGLAVAGATLQAMFSNPLCEPYTLGISSGSALGAVLGSTLGLQMMFAGLAAPAFLGAILFTGALYFIALRPGSGSLTLLLSGVMLGFLGSSLVALWMAFADANGIQGALLWLMGDLSRARLSGAVVTCLLSAMLSLFIWGKRRELDALLTGGESAAALGVDVNRARRSLLLLTSLLIGLCVSGGGMIGFVGLVVPHFARWMAGSLHRHLIPLCAIWGATALTISDGVARALSRPYELPVGVVTALAGAPLFLWIMLSRPPREASE